MKYLVILPAFNEEESIAAVIADAKESLPFCEILVVNDGSDDKTHERAAAAGITVIDHPFNLGYGAALQTGFRYAVMKGFDFVITIDADGQHVSSSARNLIDTMEELDADVVIGSRFKGGGYRMGTIRKIGVAIFSLIARTYTGINITDPTSGFQLLRRQAFSYLAEGDNYPLDYPDVNIIMALHKRKFRIAEAPVAMKENLSGRSMHDGLKPALYVLKMWLAIIMVLVRGAGR